MADVKRYSVAQLRAVGRSVENVVRPPADLPAEIAVPMPVIATVKKARKRVAPTPVTPATVEAPGPLRSSSPQKAVTPHRHLINGISFQLDEAMQEQLTAVRELMQQTGMSCEDIILKGADESPPPLLCSELRPTAAPFQPSRLNATAVPFLPVPDPPAPAPAPAAPPSSYDADQPPGGPDHSPEPEPDSAGSGFLAVFAAAISAVDRYTTPSQTPEASSAASMDGQGGAFQQRNIVLPPVPEGTRPGRYETDSGRLMQRERQLTIARTTDGYKNMLTAIERGDVDPGAGYARVPNIYLVASKRSWDAMVRRWRNVLHTFDDYGADTWTITKVEVEAKKQGFGIAEAAQMRAGRVKGSLERGGGGGRAKPRS